MGGVTKTQTKQAGPSSAPEAPARAPAGLAEAMADTPLGRTAQTIRDSPVVQARAAATRAAFGAALDPPAGGPAWLAAATANSPLAPTARMIRDSPVMQARAAALRAAYGPALDPPPPVQRAAAPPTGLPGGLKAEVEARSGLAMDDVRVHRDSPEPAQVQALATARGTDIHLAPGQEQHLPHEAWHVVQQKQGRVAPTLAVNGVAVNDDAALEREADAMGAAAQRRADPTASPDPAPARAGSAPAPVVQRKVGFEFETGIPVKSQNLTSGYSPLPYHQPIFDAKDGAWKVTADADAIEFVTQPFDESLGGRAQLAKAMTQMEAWAGKIPDRVKAVANAGKPGTARVDSVDENIGTTANLGSGWFLKPLTITLQALEDKDIEASPQASAGVRLDRITELVDQMINVKIDAEKPQKSGEFNENIAKAKDETLIALEEKQRGNWVARKNNLIDYERLTGVAPQDFASSLVAMNIEHALDLFSAKKERNLQSTPVSATLDQPRTDFKKLKGFLTLVASYLRVARTRPRYGIIRS